MQELSNKIVSVIVVTCGAGDYLRSCLDSIIRQTHPRLEIIVIDNSCDGNFSRHISDSFHAVKLYSSPKNLSYCESLNKGIQMSNGDFILCLNDDVALDRKFIEEALRAFGIDDRIGMVSGKILRHDGKIIDSAGLFLSLWRTAKERGYGREDRGQYEKEEYIFGVSGAAAFYRRKMLENIKMGTDYFDSDYRFFYEDLDIAWRGQNSGWKAYYTPRAIAYHVRGASVRAGRGIDMPYARRYLNDDLYLDLLKNRYPTVIKNESASGFLFNLPFMVLYDIIAWGCVLFSRPTLIKKFILSLNYLKSAFRKRKLIKKLRFSVGKQESGKLS